MELFIHFLSRREGVTSYAQNVRRRHEPILLMVTLEKARELLGEEYESLSDENVMALTEYVYAVCEYVVSLTEMWKLDED